MSRIGKRPIPIPEGVKVEVTPDRVIVAGKHGRLEQRYEPDKVSVELRDGQIAVERKGDSPEFRARHGLYRSLIANMVRGVAEPYSKTLILKGLGFRARLAGRTLELEVGFSHPVRYEVPEGVLVELPAQDQIVLSSPDKQLLGQVAAKIRAFRKPEPYQGKGIRYKDEQVVRKEGKLGRKAAQA
ncbi:MAG: 50S ribosomal protein L6 [Candidatus Acetothermia bacterium]|jgi:large subunit ribosomal protein L6|nr:50S ribosomal protein L6 [Candidatus Acetothermia bacterium]MDH7505538.1 50S ribosomal protein L6 [Candidatus Acetothermia bacterium]